jgi:hypothetical protein
MTIKLQQTLPIIQPNMIEPTTLDRHFIKEKLCAGLLCTLYVKSGEQLANILTKRLSSSVFHTALCKLGMRDIFASV